MLVNWSHSYIHADVLFLYSIFHYLQEGKTALYWAVEKGYVEICKLLLNNDPDLEIANKVYYTAIL